MLAGDLVPAKLRAIRLAAEIRQDTAHILYVPGNHEFASNLIRRMPPRKPVLSSRP